MGDRAYVIFHNEKRSKVSPIVYLHWDGYLVLERIAELRTLMAARLDDVEYSSARFVGICCAHRPGDASIGIWNGPHNVDDAFPIKGPGDAGVFLVNCKEWTIRAHGGYGVEDCERCGCSKPGWVYVKREGDDD